MYRTLQPIVDIRQQLIVGSEQNTLSCMSVISRDDAKEGFAQRFNEALNDVADCPPATGRGRAAWVSRRYKISPEGASKWLDGRVMPDQTNMARIATDINVTPHWLWAGQQPKRPPDALEILTLYEDTDDLGRSNILQTAKAWHEARKRGKPPSTAQNTSE
jgi:hypothetical protein